MSIDGNILLVGMLFSAIGMGYLSYGKKVGMVMPILSGLALCVYPYFLDNMLYIVLIGVALLIMPFLLKF